MEVFKNNLAQVKVKDILLEKDDPYALSLI